MSFPKLKGKYISIKLALFLVSIFFIETNALAERHNKLHLTEQASRSILKDEEISIDYILDAGDEVYIDFVGLREFSRAYLIGPLGYIHLPEVGKLKVKDLTIDGLQKKLTHEISQQIIFLHFLIYL